MTTHVVLARRDDDDDDCRREEALIEGDTIELDTISKQHRTNRTRARKYVLQDTNLIVCLIHHLVSCK